MRLICFLFLSSICFCQQNNTIGKDVLEISNAIKSKDFNKLNASFCSNKDLKKIFVNSDTDDFEKIKKNWGYFLDKPENSIYEFLTSKLTGSQISNFNPLYLIYEKKQEINSQFKISSYAKIDQHIYELELYVISIDDEYYYRPKEPISKIKIQSLSAFEKELQDEKFDKFNVIKLNEKTNVNSNSSDLFTYAMLDTKPMFTPGIDLAGFSKRIAGKTKLEITRSEILKSKLQGRLRVMVGFVITKNGEIEDLIVKSTNDELSELVKSQIKKYGKVLQAGKKNSNFVDTKISMPITISIN